MLDKIFKRDDVHEFKPILSEIEESPVNPLGRFTFWCIVALLFVTILWLFLGKVDVVVTSRGMVIPDGEIKIIQPLDTGVIRKILVKEGDFVQKGQNLVEIDPSSTEPALESVQKNLANVKLEVQRLQATSDNRKFINTSSKTQLDLYTANINSLKNQLEVKKLELNKINEQVESSKNEKETLESLLITANDKEVRLKKVLDIIPKNEYEQAVKEVKSLNNEINKLSHRLKELSHQENQVNKEIEYIKTSFKAENLKLLTEKEKQAIELQANADQITFRNQKQKITSPVDGYVNTLFMHTIGGVVTPAQQLLSIVPTESPLLIKATVLNKDIGFIKEEMPVSIKIDTFDFQKYGLLDGVVKQVSKTSIQDENLGPVYEVYITPLNQNLIVEGKEESIKTGMSLNAEIKVGKRRIIEFFIYPLIKYLDEGISVR